MVNALLVKKLQIIGLSRRAVAHADNVMTVNVDLLSAL